MKKRDEKGRYQGEEPEVKITTYNAPFNQPYKLYKGGLAEDQGPVVVEPKFVLKDTLVWMGLAVTFLSALNLALQQTLDVNILRYFIDDLTVRDAVYNYINGLVSLLGIVLGLLTTLIRTLGDNVPLTFRQNPSK